MRDLQIFGVIAPMFLNMILFNCRKSNWVRNQYKWIFVTFLFVTGIILSIIYGIKNVDIALIFWALMTPAIFSLIDYGFQSISISIHNRDYYLWIRGSSELSDSSIKFKASDRIISIINIYLVIFLPFIPLFFLKIMK